MPRLPRALLIPALLLAVSPLGPPRLRAQTSAVLDEGTLMVSRQGQPVGRESFRILRAPGPGGQAIQATSSTSIGTRRVTTVLGTDSLGLPLTYESKVFDANVQTEHVSGRGRPGRFSVLARTPSGEAAREYVLENGAVLIDREVFHHYYFLALAGLHARFNVIEARSQEQHRFDVQEQGTETLMLGGTAVRGRHFVLTGPGGTREVWVDAKGRLLKVLLPAEMVIAVRDDPPRN